MTEADKSWGKIAIVGRAGRFPGASNVEQFWRMLAEGRLATTRLTDAELLAAGVSRKQLGDPHYVKAANILPDMECFDAGFFGFSPREASILDPQHRHFLECAYEALEDAGHVPERFAGRIGVYAGVGMQAYFTFNVLSNPELVDEVGLFLLRHTGNDKDFLPTRLSYLLNLTGPSVSVQAACSTGLVSVHLAMQSLLAMECDMAIAGAVTIEVPHRQGYRYAKGEILSPDGLCRAFDDDSQGTVFGSGVGLVVLRRLQDALDDGDDIKAVILGSAINNDGASKVGYLAPSIDGQAAAAAEALGMAAIPPETIGYLEAHGTGTPIGDPIELAGLTQAYGAGGRQFCGIGSVKSNIGHLDTAAGTASLIKVVEALQHEQIPPSLHYKTQNRRFDLPSSPFYVVDRLRPWPRTPGKPRRAGVNSLGVGGTNAHVLVEEAPRRAPAPAVDGYHLLPISARTVRSIDGARDKWRAFANGTMPDLVDVAHTLQLGRRTYAQRLAIAAREPGDVRRALAGEAPWLLHTGSAGDAKPEIVFAFPGGGAQYPGAGVDLWRQSPTFRAAVEQCFVVLAHEAPRDLHTMMFERTFDDREARDKLTRSAYAIPALFVLEYAYAKWWQGFGIEPDLMVAHSVGEYVPAVLAGVMALDDALRIVALRGRVMDQAPEGAMTTVPVDEATVRELVGDGLDIAALNAPELSVVSGTREAIDALEARLRGTEHEARRIRIDVAAHSRVLDGQLDEFRAGFAAVQFRAPSIPLVSSLRGGEARDDDFQSADYWVRHLRHTVRFTQAISAVLAAPNRIVLEVGPGQTLRPLIALAEAAHPAKAVIASARRAKDQADDTGVALAALGGLWAHGVDVDWDRVRHTGGRRVSLPSYAFEKQRHWIEPGRGAAAASESTQIVLARRADLADWCETTTWNEAPLPAASVHAAKTWLVLAGDDAISRAVLATLQDRGVDLTVVTPGPSFARDGNSHHYRLPPDSSEDFERLFEGIGQAPDCIVDLWPLAGDDGQRLRFDAAFALLRALLKQDPAATRFVVATNGLADLDGETVRTPASATLLGIVGVAPREIPGLSAGIVDLDPDGRPGELAERLLAEAMAGGTPERFVAWRGTRRLLQRRVPARTERPTGVPTRLRDRGVYVITGGTGGIGRALAEWLAGTVHARVALLARNAAPDRATEQAITRAGGEVLFVAADVTDRIALATALAKVRDTFGAIHGVFHAAGTIDDAPLAAKTLAQAQAVMAPKLGGARHLDALLPDGTLDLFCVFSSSSVVLCPPGQIDYVAANAAVEAIAAARRDGFCIAWAAWRDVGMAERTYGVGNTQQGPHPLLGARDDQADGQILFTRRFDANDDWVLAEHRVAGQSVLPGTAYIEIAAAVARAMHGDANCELQALTLTHPMLFATDQTRLVTVRLRPIAAGHELTVESRAGAGASAVEHARVRLVKCARDLAPVTSVQRQRDAKLDGIPPDSVRSRHSARISFGPRWQNVERMRIGQGIADGSFRLPDAFAADLADYRVHPALLDMAATIGLELLGAGPDRVLYAPIAIDRIRLFAALPQQIESRAVLVAHTPGRTAAFDVEVRDAEGHTVALIERLTMRAVPADGLAAGGAETRLTDLLLARGIRQKEAPELFARVLAVPDRKIIVSPVSLDDVRLAMAETQQPRQREHRPAGDVTTIELPRNPAEVQLAAIWSDLLGIREIGRNDDFFALGGHSLNAVRMLNRLRKQLDVDLPLTTLFERPTIRALAERLIEQRPELAAAADADLGTATAATPTAMPPSATTAPTEHTIETTAAQREIFAAILIDPGVSRAYSLSFSWHFAGPFDQTAAAAACGDLLARHDSLRSTFAADGMTLVIHREVDWQMERIDLAELPAHERDERRRDLHEQLVETPFDLQRGPVFRAIAIRLAQDRHELLFGAHHICCDGWSIGILMRDFHACYQARRAAKSPQLPAPSSIADFAAAEQAWQQTPAAARHRDYWLALFADGAPTMDLPTGRARPLVKTTRAGRIDDRLDPDCERRLREAARALGLSLPNFVFAAFHLYLGRATSNRDVVVGLPTSGQLAHGLDGVVGHCVNFLPIRSHIDPNQPFAGFCRDVRQNLAAALDHQNFTYGALVRELRLRRDPARVALVPVIFNIDNLTDLNALAFAGLRSSFHMNPRTHEHFELFVNLLDEPGRVLLSWSYNLDLFDAGIIERHLARFRRLLLGLAERPQQRLGAVGQLLANSIESAIGSQEDPGAAGPQTICEVFRRIAAGHGTRTAVQFGAATMDYATLDARSDALAAMLVERGVRSGDLVGITSQRALELVVAVLGTLKAGAAYVPFDRSLPADRLTFMAADTDIRVLLGECDPVAATGVATIPFTALPRRPVAFRPTPLTGNSPAYVMYTSGTTGRPKGVVLPHRSVIRLLVDTDWLAMGPDTVTLHSSAFAFDTSIIDLFAALLHGGKVVIPPDGTLSIPQLAEAIEGHGVNTLWLTSGLFHAIADLRPRVFAAVDQVVVGGDVVSPVQVEKVMDACPGVTVINGYGPTESHVTNAHRITRADLASGLALPIGRAIRGTQVWVVDDCLQPVEAGVQGELVIGGRGLALGYHRRPELTAAKFVQAPWDATLRIYRSGDIAMDPGDGVIRFFGRMDGQVKIRGFRVELVEVEAAIESHPNVRQAVVVAVVPPGQSDKVLAAYLVPEGLAPSRREMDDWLRARLPDFARPLHYTTLASIPLNQNGKVDRPALPSITPHDEGIAIAVVGPIETRIAAIWRDLLGLETVGAESNFFELGGHSLLAVRLFDAIDKEFAVELPISTLFQHPTVRFLATAVAAATTTGPVAQHDEWDTSVVIGAGPGDDTTKAPLFIVGGVGGNVNNLYELGRAIGRTRQVVGFQTRGVLGHQPLASIEAMATDNLRYLRRHQPRGPYLVAGYSGGALTAFEMARQLVAGGEQVTHLFVFDTFAPGFAKDFRPRVALTLWQRLRCEFDLLREEGIAFFFERLRAMLQRTVLRRPTQWLTKKLRPSVFRFGQLEHAWRLAAGSYTGGRYEGAVTLLQTEPRALMSRLAHAQDETLGWGRLVDREQLQLVPVPGDHLRMLHGNNATVLAAVIERCLSGQVAAALPAPRAVEPGSRTKALTG